MFAGTFSIPVRLSQEAGYVRDWCGRIAGLQTLVSARQVEHGEPPQTINGVLLAIYDAAAELQRLAKLNKISIGLFEPLGWHPLPDVPFVYIFTPFKLEPVNRRRRGANRVCLKLSDIATHEVGELT